MKRAIEMRRPRLRPRSAHCVLYITVLRHRVNQPVCAPDTGRHRRRARDAHQSRPTRSGNRRTPTPHLFVSSSCAAQDADGLPRTRHTSTTPARHHRKRCDVGSRRRIRLGRRPKPDARIQSIRGAPREDRVRLRGASRCRSATSPNPPHLLRPPAVARPDRVRRRHPPILRPHLGTTRRPLRRDPLDRHRREHDNAHHRNERTHGHTRCCNLHRNSKLHHRLEPRRRSDGVRRNQQQRRNHDRNTRPSLLSSVRRLPTIRSSSTRCRPLVQTSVKDPLGQ